MAEKISLSSNNKKKAEVEREVFDFHPSNYFGKFYNFAARLVSYSAAVALSAGWGSIVGFVFAYFYVDTLADPKVFDIVRYWVIGAAAVAFSFHAISYGILAPIGFPGVGKYVVRINSYIVKGKLRDDLTPEQLKKLLVALSRIPLVHGFYGVFWFCMVGVAVFIVMIVNNAFLDGWWIWVTTLLIAVSLHFFNTVFISELGIGPMLAHVKKTLTEKQIEFEDKPVLSIRLKFLMLLVIIMISIYITGILAYKAGVAEAGFINIIMFGMFMLISFLLIIYIISLSIFISIREVLSAISDLKEGGAGELYPRSQDKEMLMLTQGVISAAKTIADYRQRLEIKVNERTKALTMANEKLENQSRMIQRELKIAADIQQGIIPQTFQEWNGLRFAARYKAMHMVSGDYFDLFPQSDNILHILMADVSGHGVPAALVTTMAKITFEEASKSTRSPRQILAKVNDDLINNVKTDEYLTAFYIVINEDHKFLFSNASHQKAKIYRHRTKTIESLDTPGLMVGAIPEASSSYEEDESQLEPGDRLILYTDGIVEARNKDNEEYGHERFDTEITEGASLPLDEYADFLWNALMRFTEGAPVKDDISFMLIESKLEYRDFKIFLREGISLYSQKRFETSISTLEKANKINPLHFQTVNVLARAYLKINEHAKVWELIEKALDKYPDNSELYTILARSYFSYKDHDKASFYAKKALKHNPHSLEARQVLGYALLKLGHTIDAQHILKEIG